MNTIWKAIKERPWYEVSSCGRVRRRGGIELSPAPKPRGHLIVHLYGNGVRPKTYMVHQLVMMMFGPPQPEGFQCRHLDDDPTNNHISNLVWGTRKDNAMDYLRNHGKWHSAQITLAKAREVKNAITGRYGELREIANRLGVPYHIVRQIKCGDSYVSA